MSILSVLAFITRVHGLSLDPKPIVKYYVVRDIIVGPISLRYYYSTLKVGLSLV